MATATGSPFDRAFLERFRIAARRRQRAGLVGGHQRRRHGQSLDFREFRPYQPGDDYRHIDFRASARLGGAEARPGDFPYLVRTFIAEEQLSLVISLDTRETMALPEAAPKLTVGRWLAEALARVALASGDRVVLHRLFGTERALGAGVEAMRGGDLSPGALRFLAAPPVVAADAGANHRVLGRRLQPAGVWVIITDLYWDDPDGSLVRALARAQDGFRWVVLVELDSWPHERALFAGGPLQVRGSAPRDSEELRLDLGRRELAVVEDRIAENRRALLHACRRGALDVTRWPWPDAVDGLDAAALTLHRFATDLTLQRLFRREAQ